MDNINKIIKKTAPPAVVSQTLRTTLAMPSAVARKTIYELTRPLGKQKRFVRKFNNEHWKGSLIMSEMIRCDDDIAIKRLKKSDIIIFEMHGGGFRVGHSTMFMESFISWLRLIKKKYNLYACIMSVEYGLAPKHKYPAPLNDCVKAYNYLTRDLGVSPSKIIFSGDSAGGALGLETLVRTYAPSILDNPEAPRENFDIPIPAGFLMSSPLVSPETTSPSWKKFHKKDLVSMQLAKLIYKEYLDIPRVKMEDLPVSRIANIRKDFDRFLPKEILIFLGTKEVLRDDVIVLADAVREEGKCNVSVYEEPYVHDWFMIHEIIKKKHKKMIAKYDELFVDFAVQAVNKARAEIQNTTSATVLISQPIIKRTNSIEDIRENIDVKNDIGGKLTSEKLEKDVNEMKLKFAESFSIGEHNEPLRPSIYASNVVTA